MVFTNKSQFCKRFCKQHYPKSSMLFCVILSSAGTKNKENYFLFLCLHCQLSRRFFLLVTNTIYVLDYLEKLPDLKIKMKNKKLSQTWGFPIVSV